MQSLDPSVSGLHFGSYSIVLTPTADTLAALARREAHRFISLDPNIRPTIEADMAIWRRRVDAMASLSSLIKVSAEDLSHLYPDAAHDELARGWHARGVDIVVITYGERGAKGWTRRHATEVEPPPTTVIDTVGAGDSFLAALLHQISRIYLLDRRQLANCSEDTLRGLLSYASEAAALTCAREGADLPRLNASAARN